MIIFESYDGDRENWDSFLKKMNFYDIRHSFNYFKYQKDINQKKIIVPYLLYKIKENKKELIGQLIIKKKKFLFLNIIYIYCGPTNIENYCDEFSPTIIKKNLKIYSGISYIRFKTNIPIDNIDQLFIKKNKWQRLENEEENLFLDLKPNVTYLKKKLTRNWRHNFYRSKKNFLETKILIPNSYYKIFSLYEEMCKIKKIQMPFSKSSFEKFCNIFQNNILTVAAYYKGKLVSIRSVVFFHNKALDIFAATSLSGRNLFASYRLLWEIILICKKKKILILDLNGLDKVNNLGVYNFKIGIGGKVYKPLGILEFCDSKLLLFISSAILKFIKKVTK